MTISGLELASIIVPVVMALGPAALGIAGIYYRLRFLEGRHNLMETRVDEHLSESVNVQKSLTEMQMDLKFLREDVKELKEQLHRQKS